MAKYRKIPAITGTFTIWRARNPTLVPHMDAVKMGTYRRHLEKECFKRMQIEVIIIQVETYKRNSSQVEIVPTAEIKGPVDPPPV